MIPMTSDLLKRITVDPGKRSGKPCIRGLRITVSDILEYLAAGMTEAEIDQKIDGIAAFSNLGEFLDIPVRHYSSGMFVRLAFATSTAVDPQILLLDEVMAAGDAAFIESAKQRMNELMLRASIVVFASHSLDVLPSFCDRTILLRHGEIVADGATADVIKLYAQGYPVTV